MSKLGNVRVEAEDVLVAYRRGINLIEGANVTITAADDTTDDIINVTIAASASGADQIPYTAILYVDGANYVANQADGTNIDTDADGDTVIQAALDYMNTVGGGALFVNEGNYVCNGDINIPGGESYIIRGVGCPDDLSSPTTTGSNWHFTDGARFTASDGAGIYLYNMGFSTATGDTWTDTWIDFYGLNTPTGQLVNSIDCGYSVKGIHPAGSSTNPTGTPSGCVIAVGRTNGPSGVPYVWARNRFRDAREDDGSGTNDNNTLLLFRTESMAFIDNYFNLAIPAALTTPNLICDVPVSYTYHRGTTMYPNKPASGGQYEHQYVSLSTKHYLMENTQLIHSDGLSGTHFTQHGAGTLYITGENWFTGEGGTSPVLPTFAVTNSGVIDWLPSGFKYQAKYNAEASDGDTIAHGLVSTPAYCSLSVLESDARYIVNPTLDATNITVHLWDDTAGEAETVDKTISYDCGLHIITS